MADADYEEREKLPDDSFAFPNERKLPLNDPSHVGNASARFNQVEGVGESEKATAKTKIKSAAKKHRTWGKEPDQASLPQ